MEGDVMLGLQALHLHVKEDWLHAAIGYCEMNKSQINTESMVSMTFELFLNSDLAECYVPQMTIPNAALKLCIVKPLIFQIIGCIDVSLSIYQQHLDRTRTEDNLSWFHGDNTDEVADGENEQQNLKNKRLLKLRLSNGKQTLHAMEFGILTLPDDHIIPGSKLLLTGRVLCRRGTLLLNDSNCQFIGGEVASLFSTFVGLANRVKALGVNADKKRPPAKPLPRSVLQTRLCNGSTLSPFLVRVNDMVPNKNTDTSVPKIVSGATQIKTEMNSSFVAPTVIHTGAPVGFVHPLPIRKFPKVAQPSAVQSRPVVRVVANHRVIPNHPQNQSKINPLIARLCGEPRKVENNVSSQLRAIHRLSSQLTECPNMSPCPDTPRISGARRPLCSVSDAFSSMSKEVEVIKEEVRSQANTSLVKECMHTKIVPHVSNKAESTRRIPSGKQDPTQKSISAYFNVVQPRKPNCLKDVESESCDARKKSEPVCEVKVVTLSQMDTDDDDEDQMIDESFNVDIIVPNRNQYRQIINVKSATTNSGSKVDSFSISHEEPSEANSHYALAEDMFVPENLSPFQTPCSSNRAVDASLSTTTDLMKLNEDGISVNPSRELIQRTNSHRNEEQHDPIKKKRTSDCGDSGRIFEELCMTPANNRIAFDVTLPTQTNFISPKAQLVSGRSIIDQFKAMDVMRLSDVMRRKSFWMLPRLIYIQGVCKVASELKAYAGCWKLNALLSDTSQHDVPCEISPQLLEKMLGFNVQSCKTLTMDIDSLEITRRKARAKLVLKSLHRLDLLLKVEFSPDAQLPIIFEVSTVSEALQVS